jgi:branched-subunit amino acid aminotransferase/4-amino-4-deoxychorismate lyase
LAAVKTTTTVAKVGSTWLYTPNKEREAVWQTWQGAFIPEGFYLGYSVFTTFVWPQSKTCWVRASLKRLLNNARELGLDVNSKACPTLESCLTFLETLALNEPLQSKSELTPWVIRVTLVAHPAPLTSFFKRNSQEELDKGIAPAFSPSLPVLCLLSLRSPATALPFCAPCPLSSPHRVVGLAAHYTHPLPQLKHGSLAGSLHLRRAVAALPQLDEAQQEALWLNEEGCFTEATTSNLLWLVKANDASETVALRGANTQQALAGITRQQVKLSAASLGLTWQEEALPQHELPLVLGGFLLNATQGLRPLASVEGTPLPWPEEALSLWQQLYTHWRQTHMAW